MAALGTGSIRLSSLTAYKTAVDAGSLSQAANLLFLSQSALSQQIRALEQGLGVELLRRTTKGIEPTLEGRLFYSYCCRVLDETLVFQRQLMARDQAHAEVWLGVETVLGEHLLPGVLSTFRGEHPDVGLRLSIDHTHELVDGVRQGTLHLAVVPDREEDPLLAWTHLLDQPLVVICHPSHPLAGRAGIALDELRDHAYVARETWTKCRHLDGRALAGLGLSHDDLDIVAEMKTFAGKKAAVMANLGFALAPWCGVWREVAEGSLVRVPLREGELTYPVFLVERAAGPHAPAQAALRAFLQARDWEALPTRLETAVPR